MGTQGWRLWPLAGRNAAERPQGPRFLIVRLSAIGDVVQTLPLACALKDCYPQSHIAWAVGERPATLLRGHEAIDELIPLPRKWLASPAMVWRLRKRLRAMQFDVAFDAQGLTKAAILAWLSGARRRIGFGRPWGRELSRWINAETVDTHSSHVVERNLELLRPLGLQRPAQVRFALPEDLQARLAAESMIVAAGWQYGFAIINVGAGWTSKLWPAERYAAVARHLGRQWDLKVAVLWAGEQERALAQQVADYSLGCAVPAPPTSLTELAALARRARLFVGSDTGPLHIAAAAGTPCVGLYGPWPAARHAPYGPQHIAIQKLFFEGSTRQRRHASPIYMEAIDAEHVCQACDEIMQRQMRRSA